jgi:hypothetical protein
MSGPLRQGDAKKGSLHCLAARKALEDSALPRVLNGVAFLDETIFGMRCRDQAQVLFGDIGTEQRYAIAQQQWDAGDGQLIDQSGPQEALHGVAAVDI